MAKRATKEREELSPARKAGRPARSKGGAPESADAGPAIDDLALNAVLAEVQQRTFADEQEALSFFYDRLLESAAENPEEREQMLEFLQLLVETDPALKADLLGAARIRK